MFLFGFLFIIYSRACRQLSQNSVDLSHIQLTASFLSGAQVSPCFEPASFRVKRRDGWETYCYEPPMKNYTTYFDQTMAGATPLYPALINIIGEYANVKAVKVYQSKLITFFNKDLTFIPSGMTKE